MNRYFVSIEGFINKSKGALFIDAPPIGVAKLIFPDRASLIARDLLDCVAATTLGFYKEITKEEAEALAPDYFLCDS